MKLISNKTKILSSNLHYWDIGAGPLRNHSEVIKYKLWRRGTIEQSKESHEGNLYTQSAKPEHTFSSSFSSVS